MTLNNLKAELAQRHGLVGHPKLDLLFDLATSRHYRTEFRWKLRVTNDFERLSKLLSPIEPMDTSGGKQWVLLEVYQTALADRNRWKERAETLERHLCAVCGHDWKPTRVPNRDRCMRCGRQR